MNKKIEKDYIECKRCNKNNFDDPEFWGCSRGCGMDCEAKVMGVIVKKLLVNKKIK